MTDQEKSDLLYMREEEKLARDIYNFLYSIWGTDIFAEMAGSEQGHMNALKDLVDKYRMTGFDPVLIQPVPGLFLNGRLQTFYDELEAKGVISETDAIEAGMRMEEKDIIDLEFIIGHVSRKDIKNVYSYILEGSYNHLEAFLTVLP